VVALLLQSLTDGNLLLYLCICYFVSRCILNIYLVLLADVKVVKDLLLTAAVGNI